MAKQLDPKEIMTTEGILVTDDEFVGTVREF